MLTTIQDLEREIDQFHKNIKDSNELMKILKSIASLTKTQTENFEVRTQALHNELAKLPPELGDLFQKKIEVFVQDVHYEHQSYQNAVTNLMETYSEKVSKAEAAISKVPGVLEAQAEAAQKHHLEALAKAETAYAQMLTSSMESYTARVSDATGAITKVPERLDAQLQKDRTEHIAGLKQIQEQYAADLARTNETFVKQLQAVVDAIHSVPEQISDNSVQQYSAFLKELEKMMGARLVQLSDTEKHVIDLSQKLEAKYDAFVAKLEATNMDQLYKYCQEMNKSINTKLAIALGGVAIAVIVDMLFMFRLNKHKMVSKKGEMMDKKVNNSSFLL